MSVLRKDQAVRRSDPEEAPPVLEEGCNDALGKPGLDGNPVEIDTGLRYRREFWCHRQANHEEGGGVALLMELEGHPVHDYTKLEVSGIWVVFRVDIK